MGHFAVFDEAPFDGGAAAELEKIPHSWAQVDAGSAISVGQGGIVAEDILPVVDLEWADVFPLRITDAALMVDGQPAVFADGDAVATKALPKPRDHLVSLRAVATDFGHVVVGQCHVKRI